MYILLSLSILSIAQVCYSLEYKVPFGYYEKFPLPESNFESICKSEYFVDKTLLLIEFMKLKQPVLLSVPPKFGKTSNIDMIKRFFEISLDVHGHIEPLNVTDNYKLFSANYSKLTGRNETLNIYQDKEFFDEHFGQYPVIVMDFGSLKGESWEEFIDSFEELVQDVMREHDYIMQSDLALIFKEEFKHYIFSKRHRINYPYEMVNSISVLAKLLFKRFKKKVILLIDNYDAPIQKGIYTRGDGFKEMNYLIGHVTQLLVKDSPYIQKSLICTHSTMLRLSTMLNTDANNVEYFLFSEKHPFNGFYGLTDVETENLTMKFGLEDNYMKVKDWFNHYAIFKKKATLFNTFSVLNYLLEREFRSYWISYTYIPKLEKILLMKRFKVRLDSLFSSNLTDIVRPDRIILADLIRMRELFNKDEKQILFDTPLEDLFLHYLMDMGYFTLYFRDEYHMIIETNNNEIRSFFAHAFTRSMSHDDI